MGTIPTNTPGRPFGDGQRVLCPPIYYLIQPDPFLAIKQTAFPLHTLLLSKGILRMTSENRGLIKAEVTKQL
jgi:hypothetical protein